MRILILFFLTAIPVWAQIEGVVVDSATQTPIENAIVRIQKAEPFVHTDAKGMFSLNDTAAFPFRVTAGAYGFYNGFIEITKASELEDIMIEVDPINTAFSPGINLHQPSECEGCHPDQFNEWAESPMRKTGLNTWVFDLYDGTGTAGGMNGFVYQRDSVHYPANVNSDCSACHSPVHWLKTFEIEPEVQTMGSLSDINDDMANGVQCEVCHRAYDVDESMSYLPGVQPESFNLLRHGDTLEFGLLGDVTFEDSSGKIMRAAYNPQLQAELCSACHEDNVDHDNDGEFNDPGSLPHETTFTEWKAWRALDEANSEYCIDCHMPTTDKDNFCIFEGDRRPGTIRYHDIRGTTPEFLENAVSLEVDSHLSLGDLTVNVNVLNDGAGHAVPTGVVIRNVILLVLARDQEGQLLTLGSGDLVDDIGGSGDMDQGYYAGLPGQAFYRNMSNGSEDGIFYTDAIEIVSDTRIQPGQAYSGSFTFPLAIEQPQSIDLDVKVIYRRSFRSFVDVKQWTTTGHGEPLADIQPPHFGHLMERVEQAIDVCGPKDLDTSGTVDQADFSLLIPLWNGVAPFGSEEPITNINHFISVLNCL